MAVATTTDLPGAVQSDSGSRGAIARTEPRLVRGRHHRRCGDVSSPLFVVLPLVRGVCAGLFQRRSALYFAALSDPEALSAIRLTLLVAAISVGLNLVFGVIAAWAIAKFEFRGKTLPDHADRSAVLGQSGDFRPGVRAAVRRAGLLGAVAAGA